MCRLYAQISPLARDASDFLAEGERSLLRQADYRKGDFQEDGWGIGWFDASGAGLIKSPKAVFKEAPRFRREAARIRSRIVIGHLRAASNPMGLSRKELLKADNAQPFTDGRFVFAHNGTIMIPREVKARLGPYAARVKGSNDSEIYFWQFRKFYEAHGSVPKALRECVRELWTLWGSRRRPKGKAPYLGLNTLVSDGTALHAMCVFPPKHPKRSLFNPKVAWGRMSFARRGSRLIVASEELDASRWEKFGSAEIVTARVSGGRVAVERRRFAPGPA